MHSALSSASWSKSIWLQDGYGHYYPTLGQLSGFSVGRGHAPRTRGWVLLTYLLGRHIKSPSRQVCGSHLVRWTQSSFERVAAHQVVHRIEEPLAALRVWDASVRRGHALLKQWRVSRPAAFLSCALHRQRSTRNLKTRDVL